MTAERYDYINFNVRGTLFAMMKHMLDCYYLKTGLEIALSFLEMEKFSIIHVCDWVLLDTLE